MLPKNRGSLQLRAVLERGGHRSVGTYAAFLSLTVSPTLPCCLLWLEHQGIDIDVSASSADEVLPQYRFLCDVARGLLGAGDAIMISRLLRGNGHLVAALDSDGRTALLRSCVGGHRDVARILVEAGADVSDEVSQVSTLFGAQG